MFVLTVSVVWVLVVSTVEGSPDTITRYICPKSFHLVGKQCYHFSDYVEQWMFSHFYCQLLNSSLSKIESNREQKLLRDFVTNNNQPGFNKSERWIDGTYDWKQATWKWGSTGEHVMDTPFTKKNVGENYKWHCIALDGNKKNKWTARKCTEKKPFICETSSNIYVEFRLFDKKKKKFNITKCTSGKPLSMQEERKCTKLLGTPGNNEPSNLVQKPSPTRPTRRNIDTWVCPPYMVSLGNKCYSFSNKEATFEEAHFECRKNKTKLAIIRNKAQDDNLRRFLNNFIEKQPRWIGALYDWKSDKWKWALTGQPLTYNGIPDSILRNAPPDAFEWKAIFMDPKMDNQWNADTQTKKKRFICQVKAKAVKKFGGVFLRPPQATIKIISQG
nr:unnamed protein product [Callosobruchus chinensis]